MQNINEETNETSEASEASEATEEPNESTNVTPIGIVDPGTTIKVEDEADQKAIVETVKRIANVHTFIGEELERHEIQKLTLLRALQNKREHQKMTLEHIGTKLGANFETDNWNYDFRSCTFVRK